MAPAPRLSAGLDRRTFLRRTAALGSAAWAGLYGGAWADDPADRYAGLRTDEYLGELRVETRIEDERVFTEGPAVDRAGNVFFTNIPVQKILKWDPRARELSVFREDSNFANGLLFDRQGDLLACEGGRDDTGRVTRTDMRSGETTVLADEYDRHPLGAPNDLALDAEGRIYFTSRLANMDPETGNVNSVYRIDPDGTVARILHAPQIDMPNGIVTSPDDRVLYLVESHPGEGRNRSIKAYDLRRDGTAARERIHYNFSPGRSGDGMAIDVEGNLYVCAGLHRRRGTSETLDTRPGVHVLTPQGRLAAFVETPEDTITNCTFGGDDLRTLYVTCGTYLLSLRTRIAGRPD